MQAAKQPLTISVIVPVHEGGDCFVECLRAIRAARPAPHELIVVADGACPSDIEAASRAEARVIALPVRSGPARARNAGAHEATGEVLFFVDADVTIAPDACARIERIFLPGDAGTEAPGAAIGSYDDAPAHPGFLSQYKNLQHHFVHQQGRAYASTFWGACGAVRSAIFREAGGFDERYSRPCIEDIELGYRLRAAGHDIRLCRDLQVKHWKAWKAASLLRADFLYRALPWTDLILRDRNAPRDLNLAWQGRASAALAGVLPCALAAGVAHSRWIVAWAVAFAAAAGLLALNARFYQFLARKRGFWFAARAIPWHWFYHFYSGVGFGVGLGRHLLGVRRAPWLRRDSQQPEPARSVAAS